MPNYSIETDEDLRDRKDEEYPEWMRAIAFLITGEKAGSQKLFPTYRGDKTRLGIIRNINHCYVGRISESQLVIRRPLDDILRNPPTVAASNVDLLNLPAIKHSLLKKPPIENAPESHWWEPEEEEKKDA